MHWSAEQFWDRKASFRKPDDAEDVERRQHGPTEAGKHTIIRVYGRQVREEMGTPPARFDKTPFSSLADSVRKYERYRVGNAEADRLARETDYRNVATTFSVLSLRSIISSAFRHPTF
jgi:hypothetical protein